MKKIKRVRDRPETLKDNMLAFISPYDRDIYLMQKFLTTVLAKHQDRLASKFFPEPVIKTEDEMAKEEKQRENLLGKTSVTIKMRLLIAFMLLWILFCIFYIFLRGVKLGPEKSKKWLSAYFMTMFNRVSQSTYSDFSLLNGVFGIKSNRIQSMFYSFSCSCPYSCL